MKKTDVMFAAACIAAAQAAAGLALCGIMLSKPAVRWLAKKSVILSKDMVQIMEEMED